MQVEFDNFIGIFRDVYCDDFCNDAIELFEKARDQGFTQNRIESEGCSGTFKEDDQLLAQTPIVDEFINGEIIDPGNKVFFQIFWDEIYPVYKDKYPILENCDPHRIYFNKMQKTVPGQGYHAWHTENMGPYSSRRILTYILYLNDVEDGGETEFLYTPKRIKPEKGMLVLWPAGITHTHRGNPPLKGDKYIMTGWVEY